MKMDREEKREFAGAVAGISFLLLGVLILLGWALGQAGCR